jgi:hypothetical protein
MTRWFEKSYSRILVDNHITEDNPAFMTQFDPHKYVDTIASTGVDSCMVPACCHNGNCYYPSKVDHIHKNLNGRDIFGQTVKLLREKGIVPIAYYTVIWHNHAAKTHPSWRMYDIAGNFRRRRYWHCCPNNREYRAFAASQLREIANYDIDGVFIDMTFWPKVCYCSSCRQRYKDEHAAEMPTKLNWSDTEWVTLQRARERWLNEFAAFLTNETKSCKPNLSVAHQFSPVLHGWHLGFDSCFAESSDYTSGDFYGDKYQQRFGVKVMSSLSKHMPFEFMISRCVHLYDHTSTKSADELTCSAATTLANGGAYFFIDAINPEGTLEQYIYEQLKNVSASIADCTNAIRTSRPVLTSDVGLYFSMASHIEPSHNATELSDLLVKNSNSNMDNVADIRTIREVLGTSIVLNQMHQPYRILTDRTTDLASFKTIIINNALVMSDIEIERFEAFVNNGGTLIVSGETSLYRLDGSPREDFGLAAVMGVSFIGQRTRRINYLWDKQNGFVSCDYPAPLVKAAAAKSLAQVAQPFTDPDNDDVYASIHSNPPAPASEYVALSINRFGKGICVYLYSTLAALRNYAQQNFATRLCAEYISTKFKVTTNAPASVEVTILKSTTRNVILICFVNFQNEMPNISVHDIKTTISLPYNLVSGKHSIVAGNAAISDLVSGRTIEIIIPKLDIITMIECGIQ